MARDRYDGCERLIVVHGNRIILWAIMSHPKLNRANVTDFGPPFSRDQVDALTMLAAKGVNHVVLKEYPEAYPAPLFKKSRYARFVPGFPWLPGRITGRSRARDLVGRQPGCRYSGSSLSRCPLGRWRGATTWKSRRSRAATSCKSSRSASAITQASTTWSRSDE